ncbi:MAG: hypothetical protein IPN02_09975 [Candidatus Microthrix sp.]|uniref:Uncharacterized protein n=1 Tax=Candidatus Neomicrothrix subdominans TaxID=2954438 RepID=A0A936NCY5_9ACTN|nr:hypothetical protein [Candidatus Microthrix subdominans]
MIAAAVASVALLLGGCSGGDDDATVGDPSTPDGELTYSSPLAEALNLGDASKLVSEQQKQVAQCMADRGWEYTPVKIPGGIEDELGAVDEYADLFDEEFRTRWGFGISTIYADDGGYADGAPHRRVLRRRRPQPGLHRFAVARGAVPLLHRPVRSRPGGPDGPARCRGRRANDPR